MATKQVLILYHFIKSSIESNFYSLYYDTLPKMIRQKVDQYFKEEDKVASILGKQLLLKGLRQLNLEEIHLDALAYTKNKRPYLSTLPQLDFNISHSDSLVLCALSTDMRLGVDVEKIKPINLLNLKAQFSSSQWEALETASNPEDLFYQYWTQKEALVKADGSGLAISFSEIDIEFNSAAINGKIWRLKSLAIDAGYAGWLAMAEEAELNIEQVFF